MKNLLVLFRFDDSVEECLRAIFKDIDIRTQEQIVNKATIVHKLLFTEKIIHLCVWNY